jgi:hypothetical protein
MMCPCRGVVEEKENRARETMCIMGLQPWALNAAWAATYASILAIVSLTVGQSRARFLGFFQLTTLLDACGSVSCD